MMGDMSEAFKAMTEERKSRHADWRTRNRAIIDAAGVSYMDKGEALLFRQEGKPKADFYPSTGRWKSGGKMHSGHAEKFLAWWNAA